MDSSVEKPIAKLADAPDTLAQPVACMQINRYATHPRSRPVQPCQGCGGAQYRPEDFNRPGGADELILQLG